MVAYARGFVHYLARPLGEGFVCPMQPLDHVFEEMVQDR